MHGTGRWWKPAETKENQLMDESQDGPSGSEGEPFEGTGDGRVDGILALLDELPERAVTDHVELYLEVLARLSDELNPGPKLHQAGNNGPA